MMKRRGIFAWAVAILLAFGSVSGAGEQPLNQLRRGEKERGFILLFDGKSLDNWVIMGKPEGWKVENGVIRSEGGKGGNWLRSKKQYDNFVLRLEWRVAPGGNSGVFVRCTEKGNPWVTGHEIQISNEQPPRDALHCTGALYGTVAVDPRPDETPLKWREYTIRCAGKKITVFVDGKKTTDGDMDVHEGIRNKPMKGYIGLQDSHTEAGKFVEYRNIRIRELKDLSQKTWTCSMHPQVKQPKPGKCPICGMNLIPTSPKRR